MSEQDAGCSASFHWEGLIMIFGSQALSNPDAGLVILVGKGSWQSGSKQLGRWLFWLFWLARGFGNQALNNQGAGHSG